ncbi:C39 family peptidase [Streptomyces sp. NPDC057654]|uniref:C39 family peptidase n=1 Tax=Streptomyces sp. NPDC057654 TaxID=3346196 RepID=UPI00367AA572
MTAVDAPRAIRRPVPYYAQWESRDLVPAIIAGDLRAADDPLWQKSGAATAEEYAFWSWRMCGMACLRMALDHWRGGAPPSVTLAEECREAGAYVRHADRVDGLIYAPFAAYARRRWDLFAESRPELSAAAVRDELAAGRLVMLSVHPSIRTPGARPETRGGHLVLAVGADDERLLIHNPSGFPDGTQEFTPVPWDELEHVYAGRGVVLGPHA